MKKIFYLCLFSLIFQYISAQQIVPPIGVGTKLNYRFFLYGQTLPVNLIVKSMVDTVKFDWNIRGYAYAYGSYLISAKAFQKGRKINFIQPEYQKVLLLADDETFAIISKAAFADLMKDKRFVYNNTTYVLKDDMKENPFKLGSQNLDLLHVVGLEEPGELWILNNQEFPLICQIKDNPLGINFTLVEIN